MYTPDHSKKRKEVIILNTNANRMANQQNMCGGVDFCRYI